MVADTVVCGFCVTRLLVDRVLSAAIDDVECVSGVNSFAVCSVHDDSCDSQRGLWLYRIISSLSLHTVNQSVLCKAHSMERMP